MFFLYDTKFTLRSFFSRCTLAQRYRAAVSGLQRVSVVLNGGLFCFSLSAGDDGSASAVFWLWSRARQSACGFRRHLFIGHLLEALITLRAIPTPLKNRHSARPLFRKALLNCLPFLELTAPAQFCFVIEFPGVSQGDAVAPP